MRGFLSRSETFMANPTRSGLHLFPGKKREGNYHQFFFLFSFCHLYLPAPGVFHTSSKPGDSEEKRKANLRRDAWNGGERERSESSRRGRKWDLSPLVPPNTVFFFFFLLFFRVRPSPFIFFSQALPHLLLSEEDGKWMGGWEGEGQEEKCVTDCPNDESCN